MTHLFTPVYRKCSLHLIWYHLPNASEISHGTLAKTAEGRRRGENIYLISAAFTQHDAVAALCLFFLSRTRRKNRSRLQAWLIFPVWRENVKNIKEGMPTGWQGNVFAFWHTIICDKWKQIHKCALAASLRTKRNVKTQIKELNGRGRSDFCGKRGTYWSDFSINCLWLVAIFRRCRGTAAAAPAPAPELASPV